MHTSCTSPKPAPVTTSDAITFLATPAPYRQITRVPEYRFDDLRTDDTVIDIGANVGAFALRAARIAHRVVAVEPVTCDRLLANIRLNGADIQVIRGALGDGAPQEIRWDGMAAVVPTWPLRAIIAMAGGCDFLKCDCEGAEWGDRPGRPCRRAPA